MPDLSRFVRLAHSVGAVTPVTPASLPGLQEGGHKEIIADQGLSRGVTRVTPVTPKDHLMMLVRDACRAAGMPETDAYVHDVIRRARMAAAPDEDSEAERLAIQAEAAMI